MASKKYMIGLLAATLVALPGFYPEAFGGRAAAADRDVVVFAAASTTNAVTEIGERFAARKLGRIKASFASSSTLAKQIASGAPADVYLSANKKWMDYLAKKNAVDPTTRFDLLGNRIVLISPVKSPIRAVNLTGALDLAALLGSDGRLSIGDPDHVPAGIYGKKAMQKLGIWARVEDRLAPMKDVRAALVLIERGEAPLGQVYATDAAISKKVRVVGTFPPESHPPIVYPVASVNGGKADAAAVFMDFLKSDEARAIFVKFGFEVR